MDRDEIRDVVMDARKGMFVAFDNRDTRHIYVRVWWWKEARRVWRSLGNLEEVELWGKDALLEAVDYVSREGTR